MLFECFVPYSQADVTVIEANGGEIEEFYFSLEELIEYCGEVEYTKMSIDVDMSGLGVDMTTLKDN
jgi:hypothetical protein